MCVAQDGNGDGVPFRVLLQKVEERRLSEAEAALIRQQAEMEKELERVRKAEEERKREQLR